MIHECTKHQPGERPCYTNHGCRCDPCSIANNTYMKRRNHDARRGHPRLIDGDLVRRHIARLDMTDLDIARTSGVGQRTISRVREGQASIQRSTAIAILSVKPTGTVEHGSLHPAGTRRRLQALVALGWTTGEIGRRLGGINRQNVNAWLNPAATKFVHAATVRRVRDLYDQMWDTTPPDSAHTTKARRRAAREGWALPLQWDDGTGPHGIDNPRAKPYEARRTERGNVAWAELLELIELGTPLTDLTRRLGLTAAAIERACHRHGRGDLWAGLRPTRLDGREQEGRAA